MGRDHLTLGADLIDLVSPVHGDGHLVAGDQRKALGHGLVDRELEGADRRPANQKSRPLDAGTTVDRQAAAQRTVDAAVIVDHPEDHEARRAPRFDARGGRHRLFQVVEIAGVDRERAEVRRTERVEELVERDGPAPGP